MRGALVVLAVVGLLAGCPPIDASEQDASIPAEGVTLEGVLHLPVRFSEDAVPAVVLVHGSGPGSRDSALGAQLNMDFGGVQILLFKEIAEALQAAGYAVLRYDKRSCGPFNGACDNDYPTPPASLVVQDFIDDGAAAGQWLATQDFIDPERVYVFGHSQGAAAMPALLDGWSGFAGGVSIAGNWRPIDVMLRYQLDFSVEILEQTGASAAQIEAALANLRALVEGVEELRAGTFTGSSIGGASVAFWSDWMAIGDARPALVAAETRPMLAINGDYDWNIPLDPELGLWGDAGVATAAIPCVTHAMNCVSNPNWASITPADIGDRVDPLVVSTLIDWLDAEAAE